MILLDKAVLRTVFVLVVGCWCGYSAAAGAGQTPDPAAWARFSRLSVWDDGLAEMSYYDATDTIYGTPRHYTRVHILNRQWMSRASGVKTDQGADDAVAVFKLNIAEQIPTENYNYRYLNTVFLTRPALAPFKMVVSSQEWCGTSFKHLRWAESGLTVHSYSYFPKEGDRTWERSGQPDPFEALVVLSRAVVAAGTGRSVQVLGPMRSSHQVVPTIHEGRLEPAAEAESVSVPAGTFQARRVTLSAGMDQPVWFDVEQEPPYRLVRFALGSVRGTLRGVERRPYWDRRSVSAFHSPGEAP